MTLYIVFINTKSKCMMISIIYTNLTNRWLNSLSMPRLCVKLRKKYKLININMMHSIVSIYSGRYFINTATTTNPKIWVCMHGSFSPWNGVRGIINFVCRKGVRIIFHNFKISLNLPLINVVRSLVPMRSIIQLYIVVFLW